MIKIEKKDLAILAISLFATSAIAVNQFTPILQKTFHLSLTNAEAIITLNAISTVVFLLLSDKINNAIGMKKGVILGLSLIIISGFIPLISHSLVSVILNRLFLGAGIGIYSADASTYLSDRYSGKKKEKLMGHRGASEMLGAMGLIYLAGIFSLANWFYGFGVYVLAIIPLLFFIKNVDDPGFKENKKGVKLEFNATLIFYIILGIFMLMNTNAMNIRFPNVATHLISNTRMIGTLTMLVMFCGMLAGIFYGKIYNVFETKTLPLAIILLLISNGMIIFAEKSLVLLVLSISLATFAQSSIVAYMVGDMDKEINKDNIAYATSILFAFHSGGSMLAPYFLGMMQGIFNFKSLTMPFIGFVIIMFIMLIYYFISYKDQKSIQTKTAGPLQSE